MPGNLEIRNCPFESKRVICVFCGTSYNIDNGVVPLSARDLQLLGLTLEANDSYYIIGGRCDECGGTVGKVTK